MIHPTRPETTAAETRAGLIDLTPALQELSADAALNVRGGLLLNVLSVGKIGASGSSQKVTDGTSNTVIFSESVVQHG